MKKSWPLIFILLVSLLPFAASFFTSNLVHTHDGLVHLPRIAAFYKALLDGQIPVRWAGDLNYGFGMPLFIFIYHTPYLVSSFLLFFGASLVFSFKSALLFSFLLSGGFMYIFANAFFKDWKKAIIVALLYQFSPFHLIDVLIRGSFGEVYAYAFLPLVLYLLTKFFQTKRLLFLSVSSLATALLVLSHNSISLLFFAAIVLFILFFSQNKKNMLFAFFFLGVGLLLAAFYWVPALFEHKYTHGDLFMKDLYSAHFPTLWKLFVPNFFDTKILQTDNLSLQLGFPQVIILIFSTMLFLKKKVKERIERKIFIYSSSLVIFSLFFMSELSLSFWEHISFLRQFQFPWRFLSIVVFATSLLGVFFVPLLKRSFFFWFFVIVIIFSSFIYWFPKEGYDKIDEKYYWNFPLNTTYYGETDVVWSSGPAKSYPEKRVSITEGKGVVGEVEKKSNSQTFLVKANTDLSLVSNTQYFPGWRVFVDDKATPIEFQNQQYRGLITFQVPQGEHVVRIVFGESRLRFAADVFSVIALVILGVTFFLRKKML